MKKRIIAVLLSVMMIMALMAGCSGKSSDVTQGGNEDASAPAAGSQADNGNSESKPVTLHVYMYDPTGTDDKKVAQAISEIPEVKALNVNIDIVKYTNGSFGDKSALALATDEPIDIIFDAGWIAYQSRVDAGAYLNIADMLDTVAPELKNTIPQALWDGVKINGGIFGVPTYKELGEQWGVYAESDFLAETSLDVSGIKCLKDAEIILEALSKTDRAGFEIYGNTTDVAKMDEMEDYFILTNAVAAKMDNTDTLIDYYETQDFADFCDMMRDWYNKGYVASDVVTRNSYDEYDRNGNHRMGMTYVSYSPQNEIAKGAEYGKELTFVPTTDVVISTSACTGSLYAICAKSENPELALKFLQVWNTVPEVKNMMCYGIEGVHYNLVDGQVQRVDGYADMWNGQNWTTGNSMISYTTVGETTDKWEQYERFNAQGKDSCFLGFSVDNTNIDDKVSNVNATITEYLPLLNCGAVEPGEYLPKFIEALKGAGIDDVVAEYQAQYDAWRK